MIRSSARSQTTHLIYIVMSPCNVRYLIEVMIKERSIHHEQIRDFFELIPCVEKHNNSSNNNINKSNTFDSYN